ncbi:RNA 2',3'-cyclic phosphodiesterase [Cohnella zeiphila]|uniref:RNA 2',3'-cyclic phosphodiesterase n=1 Tax=Cohnella zeiphila TaxID=2761120 RepID=A0A7X0VVB3_9BACL|nr:RNA 2',3'-cyclic phosphodiesterase [Cohnella zeiphila]MBB6731167.1 RNA 2',3'-cyclic phosphodiesterase [Cohnella zeiphila]
MDNFRLFLGVALSASVGERLGDLAKRLADRLPYRSWTHPADYHITLHFLGDLPPDRIPAIQAAAREAADRTAPFALALGRPGTFGPPDAPRVLWCGLTEPAAVAAGGSQGCGSGDHGDAAGTLPALAALYAALAKPLAASGFALEARPYRAHVTLARRGGPGGGPDAVSAAWHDAVQALAPLPADALSWTAESFALFRTHFGRRPAYERLAEFPFGLRQP